MNFFKNSHRCCFRSLAHKSFSNNPNITTQSARKSDFTNRLEDFARPDEKVGSSETEKTRGKDLGSEEMAKSKSLSLLFANKKNFNRIRDEVVGLNSEGNGVNRSGNGGLDSEHYADKSAVRFKGNGVNRGGNSGVEFKEKDGLEIREPLSLDMGVFADFLYRRGYFKDANFLRNEFDVTCFGNDYGRNYLRFAAIKFGEDHRDIARWLSTSDLKKIVQFGCPSLGRKTVFSAKTLRFYFEIQEEIVCKKCLLKESCKSVNQKIWSGDAKSLDLAIVLRIITLYALECVPPQLVVPDEIKISVGRLLREIMRLSQTIP